MYWKGLRIGTSDGNETKRRSLVEPQSVSRHSEQISRPTLSTTNLAPRRSESAPRSPTLTGPDADHPTDTTGPELVGSHSHTPPGKVQNAGLSVTDSSNWRFNRFSFMRLRHASDPQLSKSYAKGEEDVPPVPNLPPPTIITTAPTSHELDQPVKRKTKFKLFPDSKTPSVEELPTQRAPKHSQNEKLGHAAQGSTASQAADPILSASQSNSEEPGRLSTTSIRSNRDQTHDSQRSSVTDARFSESSRSDRSAGDSNPRSASPREGVSGNKRFRMPRLKRHRSPLFPLPPKPTGNDSGNGHAQSSAISKSAAGDSAPKSDLSEDPNEDHVSPLPSPTRSSVGLASSRPPLLRNDSAASAHSARSTPSNKSRAMPTSRTRSSTLDSLANARDNGQSSPHLISGRTSTSTSGRKSFGDIFNIPHRFRQNSDSPVARSGSPGTKGPGTPGSKLSLITYPERQEGDTPATYLTRLEESIPRGAIAGVLAQSNDDFFKTALRKYMRGFSFFGDPIDMAIRKLLMEVELPKETQQIDRFLQSFADRYHECNPGIFASTDQAYFIAFSILILHTDVFNKNNKRKMQKPDYVKNTRGEGISEDILECFYENISYTPFIHIEDTMSNGRQFARPRRTLLKATSTDHLVRATREPVDPYTLILDGKLDSLRPSLRDVMNLDDTYCCDGTDGPANIDGLHHAFSKSGVLQIVSLRSRPDMYMPSSIDNPADSNPGLVDIKIAKVGLLWRKDPKKKRARSPWQEWGALLTFSQLYFFKDVAWVKSLMAQHESHQKEGRRRAVVFKPPLTEFKPDGIMSTEDAVALLDLSYKKHKHAFVFVRHGALEEVFLANTEADMNDWVAKLNYAATFRTTGVRTKGMIATNYEAQRNRMSRRGSTQSSSSHLSIDKEPPSPNPDTDVAEELVTARRQLIRQKIREANEKLFVGQRQLDDLLRNARHLQILTPVHSRAREHVIIAAGRMAAKLKWVRQDIWRTKCYREVLVRDIGEALDEEKPLAEQKLHLQIPTTTVTSEPENLDGAGSDRVMSPTEDNPSPLAESSGPHSVYKTPPSQPASPDGRRPSIPASFASLEVASRVGRQMSMDNTGERAKSCSPHPASSVRREASVLSAASKVDVSSLGSRASKITAPGSMDENEERLLRETGLLEVGSSPQARKHSSATNDSEADQKPEDAQGVFQGERTSRIRRSLHRTLRDSPSGHHLHYPRKKKSRDSGFSMATPDDNQKPQQGEGLSRKSTNFTVHGKKASIVTFGSEWQNMPPEERLKLRKPTPSDEPRASNPELASSAGSVASESLYPGSPHPLRSGSIATKGSARDDPWNSAEAAGALYREDKAKSDAAIGLVPELSEPDVLVPPILTWDEPSAVSNEGVSPHSTRGDNDSLIENNTPQGMSPSPPEQAVNA
ncbi:guanyl-nucleotide exchange factor [Aspergillus bombycis]|uniref:Guanyl-nucleotide exchange factor n=1 Tax=Aspergillus bombycis TaxID=109264 RepID=A0A1F7ZZR1_9EURO|nr:guanyl-nucleotide exchange factor [Aspergillus bombycis]OGM44962.1 guanyl-nucleotide exchange factor [Aspergillus bombycis]